MNECDHNVAIHWLFKAALLYFILSFYWQSTLPGFISIIPIFLIHSNTLVKQWQPCIYFFIFTAYSYHHTDNIHTILPQIYSLLINILYNFLLCSLFYILPLSNFHKFNIHCSLSVIKLPPSVHPGRQSRISLDLSAVLVSGPMITKIQYLWSSDGLVHFLGNMRLCPPNNLNPQNVIISIPCNSWQS